jgi:hypothetical protein
MMIYQWIVLEILKVLQVQRKLVVHINNHLFQDMVEDEYD